MSPHEPEAPPVCIDARGLASDAAAVDALARLALDFRRAGYRLILRNASPELLDLIQLSGLTEALPSR